LRKYSLPRTTHNSIIIPIKKPPHKVQ
jgi:hypothetical protein